MRRRLYKICILLFKFLYIINKLDLSIVGFMNNSFSNSSLLILFFSFSNPKQSFFPSFSIFSFSSSSSLFSSFSCIIIFSSLLFSFISPFLSSSNSSSLSISPFFFFLFFPCFPSNLFFSSSIFFLTKSSSVSFLSFFLFLFFLFLFSFSSLSNKLLLLILKLFTIFIP